MQYTFLETDYLEQQKKLNLEIKEDRTMCCTKKWCPSRKCGKKLIRILSVFKRHTSLWKCTICNKYFLRIKDSLTPSLPMEHAHGDDAEDRAGISTSPDAKIPAPQGNLGHSQGRPLFEAASQLR